MKEIEYELTFEETIESLTGEMDRWFAGPRSFPPDTERFSDPVYFKTTEGVVVHSNSAYRKFFSKGVAPVGRLASTFLDNSIISVSKNTDALIASGVQNIQFEHLCLGPNNDWYMVRTFKKGLMEHSDGAYEILGISRPIWVEESSLVRVPLEEKLVIYEQLDAKNKRICILFAEGRSASEIGQLLDVTSKTVDNRRKKILELFEFEQSIDIVKMMVRFEERGYSF